MMSELYFYTTAVAKTRSLRNRKTGQEIGSITNPETRSWKAFNKSSNEEKTFTTLKLAKEWLIGINLR